MYSHASWVGGADVAHFQVGELHHGVGIVGLHVSGNAYGGTLFLQNIIFVFF